MSQSLDPSLNPLAPQQTRVRWWKRGWVWVVVVFVAVWFGLPLLLQPFVKQSQGINGTNDLSKFSGSKATPQNTTYDVVTATSPTVGPVTAPVTVVEFGDFQCPYCRAAEPILKQMLLKYPEAVRLMYRHFPLTDIHAEALSSAEAAACADAQDKFWPYHDQLYANQEALGETLYTSIATSLKLDLDLHSSRL
jgi:protein-disulfide isomerase